MAKELEELIQFVRLEHTTQGHNKFYEVRIFKHSNQSFTVEVCYGKIGATNPLNQVKGTYYSKISAETAAAKLEEEKLDKGYKVKSTAIPKTAEPVKAHAVPQVKKDAKPKAFDPTEEATETRFDLDLD